MANEEHLAILKQGVGAWNRWRDENSEIQPDLTFANLRSIDLKGANFSWAILDHALLDFTNLNGANFDRASLIRTSLNRAVLKRARFENAFLYGAQFIHSDLSHADFTQANLECLRGERDFQSQETAFNNTILSYSIFSFADLSGVNFDHSILDGSNLNSAKLIRTRFRNATLTNANLSEAVLDRTCLNKTDLREARFGRTIFATVDLSECNGLDTAQHLEPSILSIDELYKSKGNIPESFLRGCGLSDWEIESAKLYNPDLSNEEINDIQYRIHDLRVSRAFQINPLFISYSHSDSLFVNMIEKHFIDKGIRFWRDIHHTTAGRLEKQIDKAIHLNDVVLLVLSEHSTNSDWLEHEARKAREKEKSTGKDALCPVALDGSWKTCRWPARLREQIMEYNILDFSNWQDETDFKKMFGKLLEGLNLFYK